MTTQEPLYGEVTKTLQHILKNVAKKEVEMKNILRKALDVLKDYPLKDPEYETSKEGYEKDITALATPFVQCCDPQNKFLKQSIAVLQRLIISGYVKPFASSPVSLTSSTTTLPTLTSPTSPPQTLPTSQLRVSSSTSSRDLKDTAQSKQLIGVIIDKICKCADGDESTQSLVVKFLQTCCTTSTCELHGTTLLTAVKTCFQLFTQSRQTQLFASAKASITNIINFQCHKIKTSKRLKRSSMSLAHISEAVLQQQQQSQSQDTKAPFDPRPLSGVDKHRVVLEILNEIIDSVVNSEITLTGPEGEGVIVEDTSFHDFCLIFTLVCQVSVDPVRSHREVHGKLLALQILHTILSKFSPTLKSSRKFVEILREHVMNTLTVNANTNEKVFQYVLSIFLDLLQYFREDLKEELGTFIVKYLLPRLETAGATQELFWMLAIFHQICKDATLLLDLFVNYDCDLDQENIFQRCVDALCRSARQPLVSQRFISSQVSNSKYSSDFQIRSSGLKCIVQLTKSLGDWKDLDRGSLTFEAVNQLKERKKKVELARQLFSESARKGLEAFIELGDTKDLPDDIAKFLRYFRGLDKAKIGEYLSKKENGAVLESFATLFDFSKAEFDLALRHFLSTFRLPGESMLIERLMQQFANKYYADNQNGHFANSDSAFVLAYSTILLATDQHNPNVKNRMTFAQWAKNNTKINDGKDFDEAYLSGIFERIGKTPLKLNETPISEDGPRKSAPFSTCYRTGLVKFMMDVCWLNLVEVFDFFMQNSDDRGIVPVCLTGYQNSVHICGIFELEVARAKFLESSIKFTKIENPREVTRKEVDSIRSLAVVSLFDGKYLGADWLKILQCLSYLAQIYRLGNSYEIIDPYLDPNVLSTKQIEAMTIKDDREVLESNKQDIVLFDASHITAMMNQISINSTLLPEEQLVLFVEAICRVSHEEIFNFSTPIVFCLQKLIDVAYYNLCSRGNKGGGVWARIWIIMSSHFIKIGTSEHSFTLRKTAIDSLEYLLRYFFSKDLEVNELFYKDLFHPFDRIIRTSHDNATRSLILQYTSQLLVNNYKKIKGGWKTVFSIYTWAANCTQALVETGLATVEEMLREYFSYFATLFFVQFVNCLGAYANSKFPSVSIRAIEGISSCAVHLANGRVQPLTLRELVPRTTASLRSASELPTQMIFTDAQEHLVVWMPVLTSLSDVLSSHDLYSVRICALDTLERVLVLFGSMFSPKLWEMIFRGVIFPIFNNIGYSKGCIRFPEDSHDWLSTTCPSAFRLIMGVFSNFLDAIEFLAGEILQLIMSCFLQKSEELLRLGAQSLLRFTTNNGLRFSELIWDLFTSKTTAVIDQITDQQPTILKALIAAPSLLPPPTQSATLSRSPSLTSISPPATLTQTQSVGSLSIHPTADKRARTSPPAPAQSLSPTTTARSRALRPQPVGGEIKGTATSPPSPNPSPPNSPALEPISPAEAALRRTSSFVNKSPKPASPSVSPIQSPAPASPELASSPWASKRRFSEAVLLPQRDAKVQSHIASLQLIVQIVETVAQAHDTYPTMLARHLRALAQCLETSYVFCHSIVHGVLEVDEHYYSESIEILDTTELLASSCYLKITFLLDTMKDVGNPEVEQLLFSRCYMFISKYLNKGRIDKRLIVQILIDFLAISDTQFKKLVGIFYNLFTQLMLDDSKKIRKVLKPVWVRIGKLMSRQRPISPSSRLPRSVHTVKV